MPPGVPGSEEFTGELVAGQQVLGVEHQRGVLGDRRRIELGMVDEHDHQIGRRQLVVGERHQRDRSRCWAFTSGMCGSQNRTSAPLAAQPARHVHRRALAPVARRPLVGQAEQQHPAAVDRLALAVQQRGHPVVHVVGHVLVDVVGQLDEPERLAQVLLHPPRQIARVDRQAVAADAGPGRELHVAERLGRRGVDRPPHVDVEVAGEHRQLVDQRDVDVAERVLEQLHQLGLGARTDRHRLVDERREERVDHRQRRRASRR